MNILYIAGSITMLLIALMLMYAAHDPDDPERRDKNGRTQRNH